MTIPNHQEVMLISGMQDVEVGSDAAAFELAAFGEREFHAVRKVAECGHAEPSRIGRMFRKICSIRPAARSG